uniref:C2 domain-containing protein n=1 Tax=Knipowitschia caucasica TaxID=637954 RepID=A0AAV2K3L8_KNICA
MEPTFKIAKNLFGLKVKKKKKKKKKSDLVLMNPGARDTETEGHSEECQDEEDLDDPCSARRKQRQNHKRSNLNTRIQACDGKPERFRVSINITEARQLVGDNIDPSVVIEIGDEKKQTSVKESTNAPFYNEELSPPSLWNSLPLTSGTLSPSPWNSHLRNSPPLPTLELPPSSELSPTRPPLPSNLSPHLRNSLPPHLWNLSPLTPQELSPPSPQELSPLPLSPSGTLSPLTSELSPPHLGTLSPPHLRNSPPPLSPPSPQELSPPSPLEHSPPSPQELSPPSPRNSLPPHLRNSLPPHLRNSLPPHLRNSLPPHLRNSLPPHLWNTLSPPHLRNSLPLPRNSLPPHLGTLSPSPLELSPPSPQELSSSSLPLTSELSPHLELSPQNSHLWNSLPLSLRNSLPPPSGTLSPLTSGTLSPSPPSPQELSPPSPQELSPPSPQELSPPSPQELSPPSPQELSPPSPQELSPPSPLELSPPHLRNSLPPHLRNSLPPHLRNSLPPHLRNSLPPHLWNSLPPHLRNSLPPHLRNSLPPHLRNSLPPHLWNTLPPHLRNSLPPPLWNSLPPHLRNSLPPHLWNSLSPHLRNSLPPHLWNTLPPHLRNSLPPPLWNSLPPHLRNSLPPHLRNTLPPHLRNSLPPHLRNSLPPHLWNSLPPHLRNSLPPHLWNTLPPHLRNSLPPPLWNSLPPHLRNYLPPPLWNSLPPHLRNSLPPHLWNSLPLTSGTLSPLTSGTLSPLTSGTLSPLTSGTLSPLTSGTLSPLTSGTLSPSSLELGLTKLLQKIAKNSPLPPNIRLFPAFRFLILCYFVFDIFAHKEVFLDKVIKLSVIHSKMLRSSFIGSFKLDVWTVYKQPGHQFLNRWAQLTDPKDINTGVKGFVKCDISVSEKGDVMEPVLKTSDVEEQIDKNLLLPEGYPSERPWAQFFVKIYKAEGLPRNSSTIMANVTKALIGDSAALIDPFVQVRFFKQVGRTSTQRSSADPVWNEQIVFTEMFPPLCQRMKIQVWDEGSMNDVAIGTHYFDLRRISNEQDGDRGFLPTFGPAWINLYGSSRTQTLGDDTIELNEGIGEGVSFRGRIYIELVVEILSGGLESKQSIIRSMKDVKSGKAEADGAPAAATGGSTEEGRAEAQSLEPPTKIEENENFYLFGALLEASMIDRKIGEKPISFEFSLGNFGNVFDPASPAAASAPSSALARRRKALNVPTDTDLLRFSSSGSQTPLLSKQPPDLSRICKSATPPEKPHLVEGNRHYMYLSLDKKKPCVNLISQWEGRTYRLYVSNMLEGIAIQFEEGLVTVTESLRKSDPRVNSQLRVVLVEFCSDAREFIATADAMVRAEGKSDYLTLLDKKRLTMCKQELQSMVEEAMSLSLRLRKSDIIKEMLREAKKLTQKIRFLVEEPQHTVPDLFIWLLSNNKRIAYGRVKARSIMYSSSAETCGIDCGKTSSKKNILSLSVLAKIDVYLWFGVFSDAWHMLDNLPPGLSAGAPVDPNHPPLHLDVTGVDFWAISLPICIKLRWLGLGCGF